MNVALPELLIVFIPLILIICLFTIFKDSKIRPVFGWIFFVFGLLGLLSSVMTSHSHTTSETIGMVIVGIVFTTIGYLLKKKKTQ